MQQSRLRLLKTVGWIWIGVSVIVLFFFGGIRTYEMFQPADPSDAFGMRYVEHPVVSLLHFAPGLGFILLAPLQFVPAIRRRHIGWHRASGRLLVGLAGVSGVYALVAAFVLPAFAGLATQLATVCFGLFFLGSLVMAFYSIRRKRVAAHREWMIRVFAIGLGVASIRAVVALSQAITGLGMEAVFGFSFWVGLSLNALVAELWIRRTRRTPVRAGSPQAIAAGPPG